MQSIHKAYCSQVAPQQSLFPLRLYVYKGTLKLKKCKKKLWKNLDYNIEGFTSSGTLTLSRTCAFTCSDIAFRNSFGNRHWLRFPSIRCWRGTNRWFFPALLQTEGWVPS